MSCALIDEAAEFGVGGELGIFNHHAAERNIIAVQLIPQQTAGGFRAGGMEVGADSQSVDVQLLAVPEAAEQTAHGCLIVLAYGVLDGSADGAICDGDAGLFIFVKKAVCNEAAQPTHAAVSTGDVYQTARPGAVGEIEFIGDRGNGDEAGQIGVVCPADQRPGNAGIGACDGGGTEHLTHNAAMDGGTLPVGAVDFAVACDGQLVQRQTAAALSDKTLENMAAGSCKNLHIGQGDGVAIALNVEAIIVAHGVVPGQAGEAGVGQVDIGAERQVDCTAGNAWLNTHHSLGGKLHPQGNGSKVGEAADGVVVARFLGQRPDGDVVILGIQRHQVRIKLAQL